VTAALNSSCELIENNAVKISTHRVEPINIYEKETKNLHKKLILEVSSGSLPILSDPVSKWVSLLRRRFWLYLPYLKSFCFEPMWLLKVCKIYSVLPYIWQKGDCSQTNVEVRGLHIFLTVAD
jgi:hypothetical protein